MQSLHAKPSGQTLRCQRHCQTPLARLATLSVTVVLSCRPLIHPSHPSQATPPLFPSFYAEICLQAAQAT